MTSVRLEADGLALIPEAPRFPVTIYEAPDAALVAAEWLRDAGFVFSVLSRRTTWIRRPQPRASA